MIQDRSDSQRGRAARRSALGFAMIELLVVLGVIVLLISLLLMVIGRAQMAAQSVTCLSNLRQISLAFQYYANDNQNMLPDPAVSSNMSWEQMVGPYLTPGVFVCPADDVVAQTVGSSYDWRDTGIAGTTLAGRRRIDAHIVLVYDSLPSWHTMGTMNVGMLDGSAENMNQANVLADLNQPVPVY